MIDCEPIVRRAARTYFWPGAEREDVEQEARVALLRARPSSYELAKVVVHRHLISLVRRETRRRPFFVSLSDEHLSPGSVEDAVEERDQIRRLARTRLTRIERRALVCLLDGEPYAHDKALDNALFRARRKLRAA